jgi:hypothetical protein
VPRRSALRARAVSQLARDGAVGEDKGTGNREQGTGTAELSKI